LSYFVTGATGFIGRHLVQELLRNREGEVFVRDSDVEQGSLRVQIRSVVLGRDENTMGVIALASLNQSTRTLAIALRLPRLECSVDLVLD